MPICRFRTLGYTRRQTFLAVRIFHPGYSLSVFYWGVDAENPGNSKTLGQQGGRWRCHVAWMQKDGEWAPINYCTTHPQCTPRCKLTHATDSGGSQQAGVGKENLPHLLLPGRGHGQSQPQRADVWHILFSDLFLQYKWIDAYLLVVSLFLQP